MDIRKIKEEMQFITGIITEDVDYLLYLLLRNKEEIKEEITEQDKNEYVDGNYLEDWFNNI